MMYDVFNKIVDSDNYVKTIDKMHCEIHEGNAYQVFYDASYSTANYMNVIFQTPDSTKQIHIYFACETQAESEINLYENTTSTLYSSTLTAINRNRQSTRTSNCTIYMSTNVLSTTLGTNIYKWHQGSGKSGEDDRTQNEFILGRNTSYLYRVTPVSSGWIAFRSIWYED